MRMKVTDGHAGSFTGPQRQSLERVHQDYNDALTFAEHDLKSNWELYKKRFLEDKDE